MTHQHQDRYDDVLDHSEAFDSDDQSLLQLSRELQTRYDFKVKEYKEQLTSDIQLCSVKWNHIILTGNFTYSRLLFYQFVINVFCRLTLLIV